MNDAKTDHNAIHRAALDFEALKIRLDAAGERWLSLSERSE